MRFKDRREAAELLAERLSAYKGQNPLVLAIPRGAVPMAKAIADALEGEMDVVLVHKLRAPGQAELAIGSVDETGQIYLGRHAFGIEEEYIEAEKRTQLETLRRRRLLYSPVHPPINPAGRVAIVVDDGIATGASMIAALRAIRAKRPRKLIAAAAVGPYESLQDIRHLADDVVCLEVPGSFYAVGQYFEEFGQVTDDEVTAILGRGRSDSRA